MAATEEMMAIALKLNPTPYAWCQNAAKNAPPKADWNVWGQEAMLAEYIKPFKAAGIRVSLFTDPEERQLEAAVRVGADIVELHTGSYAEHWKADVTTMPEWKALLKAVRAGVAIRDGSGNACRPWAKL